MKNKNPNNNNEQQQKPVVVNMDENKERTKKNQKVRFKYTVKDKSGKVINGYFDAYTKIDVHSFLLSQEYQIINIEEDKLSTKMGIASFAPRRKMKAKELNFFLTQLSTYIKSGIPLADSVAILSRQTKSKKDKYLYQRLVYELNRGNSFSEALINQGEVFPKLLINMVKTSELTGDLTTILDDQAKYYKEKDITRKQIVSAMTYPTVIFIFAVCVITFIMVYVVPEFVEIYENAESALPSITQVIIGISYFLKQQYIIIIILLLAFLATIYVLYKSIQPIRRIIQTLLMKIPVVKKIIMYNEVIMFTSTFASLVNHDVFITDSMAILKQISNNEIYKSLISKSIDNLSTGEGVAKAFQDHWAFPPTAYEMLVTGEKTGRLGPMMQNVADYYSEEQKNLVTQLKSLIEPIMIVFLAITVGTILLSVILPMFGMYGNVLG